MRRYIKLKINIIDELQVRTQDDFIVAIFGDRIFCFDNTEII